MAGTVTVGTGQDEEKIQDGRNATPDDMTGQGIWDIEMYAGGFPSADNRWQELIADATGSSNEDETNYRRFVGMVSQLDSLGYAKPYSTSDGDAGPGIEIYNSTDSTVPLISPAPFTRIENMSLYRTTSSQNCYVLYWDGQDSIRTRNAFVFGYSSANHAIGIYPHNSMNNIFANTVIWEVIAEASGKQARGFLIRANTGDASAKIYHSLVGKCRGNSAGKQYNVWAASGRTCTVTSYNDIAAKLGEAGTITGWFDEEGGGTETIVNFGCADHGTSVNGFGGSGNFENKDSRTNIGIRSIGTYAHGHDFYPQILFADSDIATGYDLSGDPNVSYVNTDIDGNDRTTNWTPGPSGIITADPPAPVIEGVVYKEVPKMYPVRRGGVMKAGK